MVVCNFLDPVLNREETDVYRDIYSLFCFLQSFAKISFYCDYKHKKTQCLNYSINEAVLYKQSRDFDI